MITSYILKLESIEAEIGYLKRLAKEASQQGITHQSMVVADKVSQLLIDMDDDLPKPQESEEEFRSNLKTFKDPEDYESDNEPWFDDGEGL